LNQLHLKWTTFDRNIDRVAKALSENTTDLPLIFDMRQMAYPVAAAYPNLRNQTFFWASQSNPSPYSSSFKQYEMEMARRVDRFYGWPKVMDQSRLDQLDQGYVICLTAEQPQIEAIFSSHKVLPILEMKRFSIYRIENK